MRLKHPRHTDEQRAHALALLAADVAAAHQKPRPTGKHGRRQTARDRRLKRQRAMQAEESELRLWRRQRREARLRYEARKAAFDAHITSLCRTSRPLTQGNG